ncbi:MAG: hypothetical protein KOO60_14675 [Gemmatimonadales bacterium]|nr:hypothetical protein [Gemmatimonadales bacterium]
MKHVCPKCGQDAELFTALVYRNENIPGKDNNWRLACTCGLDIDGSLTIAGKTAATLLYFAPIAVLWGLFLIYGGNLSPAWLQFVCWLAHIIPGVFLGDRFSSRFTEASVEKQLRRSGLNYTEGKIKE